MGRQLDIIHKKFICAKTCIKPIVINYIKQIADQRSKTIFESLFSGLSDSHKKKQKIHKNREI
jgi:hypothetical protein